MNYTEKLGADAYIAGNMGSMPPRDMQQWIEYMTADGKSTLAQERRANGRDKPWTNLKYFGVGNETWGCGGNMTAEHAANEHRRSARSEAHTSALQSLMRITYAAFCWNKKKNTQTQHTTHKK